MPRIEIYRIGGIGGWGTRVIFSDVDIYSLETEDRGNLGA